MIEMGEIAVGVIWQAVENHMVEIALLKEFGRESFFHRHIINLLVNDLEGAVRVLVRHLIFVLLPAGLGVWRVQQGLLLLKTLDALAEGLDTGGVFAAFGRSGPFHQFFQRHIIPALETVVDIPYHPRPIPPAVLDGVNIFQAVKNPSADLQTTLNSFVITHRYAPYIIR